MPILRLQGYCAKGSYLKSTVPRWTLRWLRCRRDLTVLRPLAAVMLVPLLRTLFPLRAVLGRYPTPMVEGALEGGPV